MEILIILEFIVLLLASLGFINIIIFSPLMEFIRNLIINIFTFFKNEKMGRYLVSCPSCIGVWVGIIMTIIYLNGFVWFTIPLAISFLGQLGSLYWFPED